MLWEDDEIMTFIEGCLTLANDSVENQWIKHRAAMLKLRAQKELAEFEKSVDEWNRKVKIAKGGTNG